jgi:hypothetical protein
MSEPNAQVAGEGGPPEWGNFAGANVAPLIDDCDQLLKYATDHGIDIKLETAQAIAEARAAFARGKWNSQHEANLYVAKVTLAAAVKPVTLHTLSSDTIQKTKEITRFYFALTLALVIIIVPVSMMVFMDSSLSATGKDLIGKNDQIGLDLHDELQNYQISVLNAEGAMPASGSSVTVVSSAEGGAPTKAASDTPHASSPGAASATRADPTLSMSEIPAALKLKKHLQEFARNNRQLYAETQWLIRLTLHGSENVYESPWMVSGKGRRENLELTLPILGTPPPDTIKDGMIKLAVYQDVRAMAQNAQRTSDIGWGAITTYLLPVMYAVLGALAFILRELTDQNEKNTFYPDYARMANRTRLIMAVIVGTVIGLFGSLWKTQLGAVSPLAIAFLAGYAADTFFSFVDKAVASRGTDAAT